MTDKERKAARKATQKQYCDSDKGKAASRKSSKRYASSDKGKSVSKRYAQSPEGKLANRRYAQSPKGKAAKKRSREKQKLKKWPSSTNLQPSQHHPSNNYLLASPDGRYTLGLVILIRNKLHLVSQLTSNTFQARIDRSSHDQDRRLVSPFGQVLYNFPLPVAKALEFLVEARGIASWS
jgi:hypothetical protein